LGLQNLFLRKFENQEKFSFLAMKNFIFPFLDDFLRKQFFDVFLAEKFFPKNFYSLFLKNSKNHISCFSAVLSNLSKNPPLFQKFKIYSLILILVR